MFSGGYSMNSIKITVKEHGKNVEKWLVSIPKKDYMRILKKYGEMGLERLRDATPVDTGKTSESWSYTIEKDKNNNYRLAFSNSNVVDGWANVAILLQYGHATRSGTWVEGRDYINPALRPIFESLANEIWKEVTK